MTDDRIEIVQGRQATAGPVTLGLVNVFDGADIRLSASHGREGGWSERFKLRRSDIFPVGGRFLRVEDIGSDAASGRATVTLVPFAAPAGIASPRADGAVAVENGELRLGDTALRVAGTVGQSRATVETWPKRDPREVVDENRVQSREVSVGQAIELDGTTLTVLRLQPAAGELLGFVEFSKSP